MFNRSRFILAVSLVGICMGLGPAQAYSPTKQKFTYSSAAGEPAETAKRAYDLNQVSVLSPYPATGSLPAEWIRIERQSHGEVRVTGAFSRGGTITQLDLNLRPHSVRSVDYQLVIQQLDGSLAAVEPGPETTLRGTGTATSTTAPDPPSTPVAVTVVGSLLTDNRFYGRIILPAGDSYWIEPLEERFQAIPVEAAGSHVLYHGYDIKNSYPTEADKSENEPVVLPKEGDLCFADLAVETDCEYFVAHARREATDETLVREGALEVEAQVALVVNLLNVPFENQHGEPPTHLDISHRLTAVVVRPVRVATGQNPLDHVNQDPYNELDFNYRGDAVQSVWEPPIGGPHPNAVLSEPLLYLNNPRVPNRGEPSRILRDAVQLMSGLNLGGGNAGMGTIGPDNDTTDSESGYSKVATNIFFGRYLSLAQRSQINGHELGHNWNAIHSGGLPSDFHPWVMGQTRGYHQFHPGNKQRILDHKNAAGTGWLECYEHSFHYFIEPEDGQLQGDATVDTTKSGHSGSGYVRFGQVSATLTIPLIGQRTVGGHYLWLRYAIDGDSAITLQIRDNENVSGAYTISLAPTSGSWRTVRLAINLSNTSAPRQNEVRLTTMSSGQLLVDQIQLIRPRAMVGDTDGDDDVDSSDQITLLGNFTGPSGSDMVWAEGDFDQDGDIDSADSAAQTANWTGASTPTPIVIIAPVDESAAEKPQDIGQSLIVAIPSVAISVNLAVEGQAMNGTDYHIEGGAFAGSSGVVDLNSSGIGVVTIRPVDDVEFEGLEKATLTLTSSSTYVLGSPSSATVYLASDELLPEVNAFVSDRYATEGDESNDFLRIGTIEFIATPAPVEPIAVMVTLGGTAQQEDFEIIGVDGSNVVIGPSGRAVVTIKANNDMQQEDPKTVSLTVTAGPTYATGERSIGTVTLIDDDRPWTLSIRAVSPFDDSDGATRKGDSWSAYETSSARPTPTDPIAELRPGQYLIKSDRIPAPEVRVSTVYSGDAVLGIDPMTAGADYVVTVSNPWPTGHQWESALMPPSGLLYVTILPKEDEVADDSESVILTANGISPPGALIIRIKDGTIAPGDR